MHQVRPEYFFMKHHQPDFTDFFKKSNDETPLFNFYEATKGRGWIKTDQLNLESK